MNEKGPQINKEIKKEEPKNLEEANKIIEDLQNKLGETSKRLKKYFNWLSLLAVINVSTYALDKINDKSIKEKVDFKLKQIQVELAAVASTPENAVDFGMVSPDSDEYDKMAKKYEPVQKLESSIEKNLDEIREIMKIENTEQ